MTNENENISDTNPGGAGNPAFAECKYLLKSYDSEENFRAVAGSEIGALDTSKLIVDFLKAKAAELAKAAGGKALDWVTAELLKAFGFGGTPNDLDEIKSLLLRIIELQEQVLRKLDDVLREVQFQHLVTRGYESVQRITNIYERLRRLSEVKGQDEREREANAIKLAVLDINSGILISLKTVSDVLTGKDQLGQGDSLIKLFGNRWFDSYRSKQLREDVPLSSYYRALDQWLHELSIIQYMGASALANARIANGDYETLEIEIRDIVKKMEEQQKLLAEEIPEWTRTLPEEVLRFDSWFVIRTFGLDGKPPTNDSLVLYGPPRSDLSKWVRFRDRHQWNWDEEWNFDKVDKSKSAIDHDVFTLVVRTEKAVLVLEKRDLKIAYTASNPNRPRLRLLMGRSLDPNVKPDTPRRDAYIPIMGFVGKSEYVISKLLSGTTIAGDGPEDKAIRFKIVPT
jgi:hypothetical protein